MQASPGIVILNVVKDLLSLRRVRSVRNLKAALLTLALLAAAPAHAADLAPATHALLEGEADTAIALLHPILAANPNDGEAHLLLCRTFYAEAQPNAAIPECAAALKTLSHDSTAQDWAGRAFGLEASRAGPINGLRLALKVRAAFEAAVQLDPQNGDAVNDLSEYLIDAPAVIGGGFDKAAHLADESQARLPQQAHRIRALSAEKQKDYATAEREFQAATAVANRPDAWVDLGAFYARRHQPDQAVDALRNALAADRAHDASLVDAAAVLTKIHREPRLAERALRDYLASRSRSDAAPAFRVLVTLASLLRDQGDTQEAILDLHKALSLASGYAPARKQLAALKPAVSEPGTPQPH
jgi:tetratricopeptide (TPR) repeat protein